MSPEADRYAQFRGVSRVRERALFPAVRDPSELELQARWFAGEFGKNFRTTAGDEIEIVQFGTWNREAGPDFHDAAIRLNGGDAIRGSVEFDFIDRSWETHGHSTNPYFDDAVLHVFTRTSESEFFTRTKSNRNVPQVRVDPSALHDLSLANLPLARPGRCQAPLKDLASERVASVIEGASQFRLQRKATRLASIATNHGRDEALFQEIAGALGYKNNKLPFTLIAQRLGLRSLRKLPVDAEAILFGVAGFLDTPDLRAYARDTRGYLRDLWDRWWPHRDRMSRLVLPEKLWRFSGARPLNHPQRRLGALAGIISNWPRFVAALETPDAPRKVRDFLLAQTHPFWNAHYTLTSEPAPKPMALIGPSRAADILANVVFPYLLSEGRDIWCDYARLPAPLSNRRLETAGARLFADTTRQRQWTKTVAHQQGLLQIYEDFCLQDNSDCAQCPFPEQMQKWK